MQYPSIQTAGWVAKSAADLVVLIGDVSYARGLAWIWEYFHAMLTSTFALSKPMMLAVGNHEADYQLGPVDFKPSWGNYGNDSGGECAVPYARRYSMPLPETADGNLTFYYSFDYGNIHFTVMSTETNFTVGSTQWQWLNDDLASVDRSQTPFLLFTGHRPLVSTSWGSLGTQMAQEFVDNIEPLLLKYDVDLVLAGHVHAYERTFPMRNFTLDESGLVYLVVGMAGNDFQVPWTPLNDASLVANGTGHFVEQDFLAFRTQSFGYCEIHTNSTHLHFVFRGDHLNMIHDEFYLTPKVSRP